MQINNDLLGGIDCSVCVILVLVLSVAFDTVDHQILLTQRKCCYDVKGNALAWMHSYISNWFQHVRVGNEFRQLVPHAQLHPIPIPLNLLVDLTAPL